MGQGAQGRGCCNKKDESASVSDEMLRVMESDPFKVASGSAFGHLVKEGDASKVLVPMNEYMN